MEINFDNFMINNKNDMFVGLIQPQPQTSMFGSVPSLLQGLVSRWKYWKWIWYLDWWCGNSRHKMMQTKRRVLWNMTHFNLTHATAVCKVQCTMVILNPGLLVAILLPPETDHAGDAIVKDISSHFVHFFIDCLCQSSFWFLSR